LEAKHRRIARADAEAQREGGKAVMAATIWLYPVSTGDECDILTLPLPPPLDLVYRHHRPLSYFSALFACEKAVGGKASTRAGAEAQRAVA